MSLSDPSGPVLSKPADQKPAEHPPADPRMLPRPGDTVWCLLPPVVGDDDRVPVEAIGLVLAVDADAKTLSLHAFGPDPAAPPRLSNVAWVLNRDEVHEHLTQACKDIPGRKVDGEMIRAKPVDALAWVTAAWPR